MKNKLKIHPDVYISLGALILSLGMYLESKNYPEDVRLFPDVFLVLFALFMLIILVSGIKKTIKKSKDSASVSDEEWWVDFSKLKTPLIMAGFVLGYVTLLYFIGFYLSSIVFGLCCMRYFGAKKLRTNILVIATLLIFIHVVFTIQLSLSLPSGLFFEML